MSSDHLASVAAEKMGIDVRGDTTKSAYHDKMGTTAAGNTRPNSYEKTMMPCFEI
jgi:hypothetical protein